jgi:hypothetical protein
VANAGRGLNIIDVSDPSDPFEVGFCDTRSATGPSDLWIQDTFAYVADSDSGLCIINIASPFSPSEIGICDTPGSAYDVFVQDTLAYVTEGNDGLHIMNVSNPSDPIEIGSYDTPSWAEGVWVQDTLAYVAADSLCIVNVSNPSSPTEVAIIPGGFNEIFMKGSLAFVIGDGLSIIDISDPSSPSEVGFCGTPGEYNEGIWVRDNLAYIANGDSGLRVIDVSNTSSPSEVGFYNVHWDLFPGDVYVEDSLIYVAYDRVGLYIFKYTGDLPESFITVTAPNGGEVWQVDNTYAITWASNGTSGNVRIEYSTNNASSWTEEIASTPDDSSYYWTIPDTPSDNCLVRVSDTDGTPADTSDAVFTISSTSSSITVTSPNGGEVWQVDSTYDVTWMSNGTSGNVQIEYSTDNGSSWTEVIASIQDTGSYPWVIPDNPSDSCLVRIIDTVGNPSDISDAVFTISSGSGVEDDRVLKEEVSVMSLRSGINIQYSLPVRKKVKVEIYNVLGQREEKLVDGIKFSGRYTLRWNGNNAIYFVWVKIGDRVYKEKAIILR